MPAQVSSLRPPLPLNAMRSFEAAARRLSFTLAGEELGVSQVAISRQVKALEHWLGVALFIRGTREVRLTAAGDQLLPPVRQVLDLLAHAADWFHGTLSMIPTNSTRKRQITVDHVLDSLRNRVELLQHGQERPPHR